MIATVVALSRRAGPTTVTVTGSTVVPASMKPAAGLPSTVGRTGTSTDADSSSVSVTAPGLTSVTSIPNGTET